MSSLNHRSTRLSQELEVGVKCRCQRRRSLCANHFRTSGNGGRAVPVVRGGTLVTAAGPRAGDAATPRLDLPVRALAQLHSDLMCGYLGLLVAMAVGYLAVRAPRRLMIRVWVLVAVTAGQRLIGLVPCATGVPEALVVTHVLGATLLVAAAANVAMATQTRGPAIATHPGPVLAA